MILSRSLSTRIGCMRPQRISKSAAVFKTSRAPCHIASRVNLPRFRIVSRAEEEAGASSDPLAQGNFDEPETAQEANDLGLKFTEAGR